MPRRRKFYTKQDYQFIPKAGKQPTNVRFESVYKYRIPQQLRLEPWDFDDRNPHGIQLDFVDPPGMYADMDAEMDAEFVQGDQNVQAPDDEDMEEAEQQGRGERRRREEDARDNVPQRVRRRVNPALNPIYQQPQRGERRRRDQNPNLNPDLIDREGGRMGGAVRLRRFNPPIERRPRPPPPPRTPGIAAETARVHRNAVVRGTRVRRHLDFENYTQQERDRRKNEAPPAVRRRRGVDP